MRGSLAHSQESALQCLGYAWGEPGVQQKKATTGPRETATFFQGDGAQQPSWPVDCNLSFSALLNLAKRAKEVFVIFYPGRWLLSPSGVCG